MAVFPKSENDIVALAETLIDGLLAHSEDFPGVSAAALQTLLEEFRSARAAQESARGQAKMATSHKVAKQNELVDLMRNSFKIAEVDAFADPDKLSLIGWSEKKSRHPVDMPGTPTNLRSAGQGPGKITLEWDRPESGGVIRNFIIKRRDYGSSGTVSNWQLINFFYDNLVTLTNQPQQRRMEYLVIACNAAGESPESNILPVIL